MVKEELSHEEGLALCSEASTSVETGKKVRHIVLPWTLLGRAEPVVQRILHKSLGKYSSKLEGVPLTYGNVRYLEESGRIIGDQPVMHLHVLADYTVFRPKYGDVIKGHISRVGNHAVTLNPYRGVSVVGKLGGDCSETPTEGDFAHVKVSKSRTHAKFFSVHGNVVLIEKNDTKDTEGTGHLFKKKKNRAAKNKEDFDPLTITEAIGLVKEEVEGEEEDNSDLKKSAKKKSKKRKRKVSGTSDAEPEATPKRKKSKLKAELPEDD